MLRRVCESDEVLHRSRTEKETTSFVRAADKRKNDRRRARPRAKLAAERSIREGWIGDMRGMNEAV